MGYTKTAFVGLTWVGLLRALLRGSALIRTAILARLLTPEQFGVFGIAAIILGLTEIFTETGINVFLIQGQDRSWKQYLNTAWVISILRGFLISLIMLATSSWVASFFRSPQAIPVLHLISLVPLTRGFINPAIVKFQKSLRFDQEFRFRSGIIFADAVTAIGFALVFQTATSLAWGLLAGAVTELILSLIMVKPRPRFQFDSAQARLIIHQGKWLTGAGIFAYFAQKTPDILIGRVLGTTQLGYFQMAYRLAVVPIEELVETVNRVAFPLYVKLFHEKQKIKFSLLRHTQVFTLISVAWASILIIFAPLLTRLILGPQWLNIVPLLQALSLAGIAFALSAPPEPVLLALRSQNLLMYFTLLRLILILLAIFPLIILAGTLGVVLAITLALVLVLPLKWYLTWRLFCPTI